MMMIIIIIIISSSRDYVLQINYCWEVGSILNISPFLKSSTQSKLDLINYYFCWTGGALDFLDRFFFLFCLVWFKLWGKSKI